MGPGPQTTRQSRSCPPRLSRRELGSHGTSWFYPTPTLASERRSRRGPGEHSGARRPSLAAGQGSEAPHLGARNSSSQSPGPSRPAPLNINIRAVPGTPKVLGGLKGELSSHLPRVAPSLPIQRDAAGETGLMTKARRRQTGGEEGVDRLGDHRRRGSGVLCDPHELSKSHIPPPPLRLPSRAHPEVAGR